MNTERENGHSIVETQTVQALTRSGLSHDDALVVGVSGGPDSTALLCCLSRIRNIFPLRLHVAHLNHDFRGKEADDDEAFVLDLAKQLGLTCTSEYQDTDLYQQQKRISSFEQGARELRYTFLLKVAHEQQSKFVAVAHTADDLAETVLEHILRGSGLNGLKGMSEVSDWPWPHLERQVKLLRPFLEINKSETSLYCTKLKQRFRQDTTNDMLTFTRNRVRKTLMPILENEYNPQIQNALIRLSKSSSIDLDYIEQETTKLWNDMAIRDTSPEQEISVAFNMRKMSALHPSMQRRLIRKAYIHVSGETKRMTETHISTIANLIGATHHRKTIHLPFGLMAQANSEKLRILHRSKLSFDNLAIGTSEKHFTLPIQPDEPLQIHLNQTQFRFELVPDNDQYKYVHSSGLTQYISINSIGSRATVRFWKPGDKFRPLGMLGYKTLQDFFTDSKVSQVQRHKIPLLEIDGEIVWVIGHRISDNVKIQNNSSGTTLLKITCNP